MIETQTFPKASLFSQSTELKKPLYIVCPVNHSDNLNKQKRENHELKMGEKRKKEVAAKLIQSKIKKYPKKLNQQNQ